jgi:hypothetical protein
MQIRELVKRRWRRVAGSCWTAPVTSAIHDGFRDAFSTHVSQDAKKKGLSSDNPLI